MTLRYVASALKVSILSNQTDDSTIASVKATVAYGDVSVEVGSGETVGIPTDTQVTVTFPDVEGYKTPDAVTFSNAGSLVEKTGTYYTEALTVRVSADDSSSVDGQNVMVEQVVSNGVYIQDINGRLWKEADWNGSSTPNGIAVITDSCRFVMALADAHSSTCQWGGNGTTVSNIVTTENTSTAKTDYKGDANTTQIISQLSGTPAAYYCRNFIFPNGKVGYMGAAGEWQAALDNEAAITSALSKCGGASLSIYYWTSTQNASRFSWGMYWDDGELNGVSKTSGCYVRAFAPLEPFSETHPVTGGKATFKVPHDTEYTVSVDEKPGYTTPASQSFTANSVTRTVSMVYEAIKEETLTVNVTTSTGASTDGQVVTVKYRNVTAENGVFIEDINGKLWKEADWDGSVTPNGIAVITENCSFVMAQDALEEIGPWSNLSSMSIDVVTTTDVNVALTDFDGYNNSLKISNADKNGEYNPAAKRCQNFTFPNGQAGYLGAFGEVAAMYNLRDQINSVIKKLKGDILAATHPSSTLYDSSNYWFFHSSGHHSGDSFSDWNIIHAFTPLKGESKTVSGGKATFTIPEGTTYEVSVSAMASHITPASQTFTAARGSRTVTMNYVYHTGTTTPTNGVWIQDTDGYFHTEAEWDGKYTPNGVAVITSNCRFVMALQDASSNIYQWGGNNTVVTGIVTTTSESTAATDYKGDANTTQIINQLSDTPAAYYCRNFIFPNGQKGYLGAAGEWQTALDNQDAIDSALSKCGGTAMFLNYWTSTQYNSIRSWYVYWDVNDLDYNYIDYLFKIESIYVRAFAAI